jgi:hypothetical protein
MAGGISKLFSGLFGGGAKGDGDSAEEAEPELYNGYTIRAVPFQNNGQWIVSGIIEKREGEQVREHRFIRADMYPAREAATEAAGFKARQMIDMMGDGVFDLEP